MIQRAGTVSEVSPAVCLGWGPPAQPACTHRVPTGVTEEIHSYEMNRVVLCCGEHYEGNRTGMQGRKQLGEGDSSDSWGLERPF